VVGKSEKSNHHGTRSIEVIGFDVPGGREVSVADPDSQSAMSRRRTARSLSAVVSPDLNAKLPDIDAR
jgi:hypothetical protein